MQSNVCICVRVLLYETSRHSRICTLALASAFVTSLVSVVSWQTSQRRTTKIILCAADFATDEQQCVCVCQMVSNNKSARHKHRELSPPRTAKRILHKHSHSGEDGLIFPPNLAHLWQMLRCLATIWGYPVRSRTWNSTYTDTPTVRGEREFL